MPLHPAPCYLPLSPAAFTCPSFLTCGNILYSPATCVLPANCRGRFSLPVYTRLLLRHLLFCLPILPLPFLLAVLLASGTPAFPFCICLPYSATLHITCASTVLPSLLLPRVPPGRYAHAGHRAGAASWRRNVCAWLPFGGSETAISSGTSACWLLAAVCGRRAVPSAAYA